MYATTNQKKCFVPTCDRSDPQLSYFLLPKNDSAKIWMERCGIKTNFCGVTMICEAHFDPQAINSNVHPKRLKSSAVPTLNLPSSTFETHPSTSQDNTGNIIQDAGIQNVTKHLQVSYSSFMEKVITKSLKAPQLQANMSIPVEILLSGQSKDNEPPHSESMDVQSTSININNETNDNSTSVTVKPMAVKTTPFKHIQKEFGETFDDEIMKLSETQVDSYIPDINYAPRTITELQKAIQMMHPNNLKMLAVKTYMKCPQGYEMLHSTLKLPPVSELKIVLDGCVTSTDDKLFKSILQYKADVMSVKQKQCVICIGTINVSKKLFYDIKRDILIGISDINNIQKPAPAHSALVLFLQGIYKNWKQPIDIAYLSTPKNDNLVCTDQWIEKKIGALLDLGFGVRAVVCDTDDLLMTTSPHHETYRNMYYIYDIMSLLKLFFYTFLKHDFKVGNKIAKMQDILDYFELDSKNTPRLSPKLTEKNLKPATILDVSGEDVMEIINLQTAAAMTTYINLRALKPTAKNTVELITKMSMLLEVLYSNKCDNTFKETRKQVLLDMISFFDARFKIINTVTRKEVATEYSFVPKLKSTIRAILMLNADMQRYNDGKALPIKRISLGNVRSFFAQIKQLKKDGTTPTCKNVHSAFLQSALRNLWRPSHDEKRETDLVANLNRIKKIILAKWDAIIKNVNPIYSDIAIKCSEYNKLDFKNKDSIILVAGFLLKKCYDRHSDCDDMKNYIFIVLQEASSICKTILKEIQENVCVVPQESFIEFVEMMEIRFRSFMTKPILENHDGFIKGLMNAVQPVSFPMPCLCFPILYAKKLYLRVRIYNMLKFNNDCLSTFPEEHKYLVVNNL